MPRPNLFPKDLRGRPPLGPSGYQIWRGVVPKTDIPGLLEALGLPEGNPSDNPAGTVRTRQGKTYAVRQVLARSPVLQNLAGPGALGQLAQLVLGPGARPIRSTLFDKTPEANWVVPWHQDTAIPVARRIDGVPGFDVWSIKAGQDYCEALAEVLSASWP
jgi:hypothetical protein